VQKVAGDHQVFGDVVCGGFVQGGQFPTDLGSQLLGLDIIGQTRTRTLLVSGIGSRLELRPGPACGAGMPTRSVITTGTLTTIVVLSVLAHANLPAIPALASKGYGAIP